jgi:hypothetical protein
MQCEGYTGRPDGTLCAFFDGRGAAGTCVKRCTVGQEECPAGYTCDGDQVCKPDRACPPPTLDCSTFSSTDTGAVRLVKRGNELLSAYNTAFEAYFADDGSDPIRDALLRSRWSSTYWDLRGHVDLIETLRSHFHWFGGIF